MEIVKDTVSDGVKLLLQRMDSNPDEFVFGSLENEHDGEDISDSIWYKFLPTQSASYVDDEHLCMEIPEKYLTEHEKKLLGGKLNELYRAKYGIAVMKTLLLADKPKGKRK